MTSTITLVLHLRDGRKLSCEYLWPEALQKLRIASEQKEFVDFDLI